MRLLLQTAAAACCYLQVPAGWFCLRMHLPRALLDQPQPCLHHLRMQLVLPFLHHRSACLRVLPAVLQHHHLYLPCRLPTCWGHRCCQACLPPAVLPPYLQTCCTCTFRLPACHRRLPGALPTPLPLLHYRRRCYTGAAFCRCHLTGCHSHTHLVWASSTISCHKPGGGVHFLHHLGLFWEPGAAAWGGGSDLLMGLGCHSAPHSCLPGIPLGFQMTTTCSGRGSTVLPYRSACHTATAPVGGNYQTTDRTPAFSRFAASCGPLGAGTWVLPAAWVPPRTGLLPGLPNRLPLGCFHHTVVLPLPFCLLSYAISRSYLDLPFHPNRCHGFCLPLLLTSAGWGPAPPFTALHGCRRNAPHTGTTPRTTPLPPAASPLTAFALAFLVSTIKFRDGATS